MTVTVTAEARHLSADELARLYCAGDLDVPALLAIDRADVRAARQRDRADAERSAWYDAAHAQWQAAEAQTCGNHLSALGLAEDIREPMVLWTGSDTWAEARASEELRAFWDANGGRLSLAAYRHQQAMAARAARDERDLAAMAAAPVSAAEAAERAAMAPRTTTEPVPPGAIARYITALAALGRQADQTARALARVNGGQR